MSVTIPPNTVQADTQISVSKELPANEVTEKNKVDQVEKDATAVSGVYSISNEKSVIMKDSSNPIYINIPYDKTKIPDEKQVSNKLYAMIWNGTTYEPAFGEIDKENGILKLPLASLPSKDVNDTKIMVVTSDNWEMVTKESLGTKALPFFPTEEKVSDKYFEVVYFEYFSKFDLEKGSPETKKANEVLNSLNNSLSWYRELEFIDDSDTCKQKGASCKQPLLTSVDIKGKKGYQAIIHKNDCAKYCFSANSLIICEDLTKPFDGNEECSHELFHAIQFDYFTKDNFQKIISDGKCVVETENNIWCFIEGTAALIGGDFSAKQKNINEITISSRSPKNLNESLFNFDSRYTTQDFFAIVEMLKNNTNLRTDKPYKLIKDQLDDLNNFLTQIFSPENYLNFAVERAYKHQYPLKNIEKNFSKNYLIPLDQQTLDKVPYYNWETIELNKNKSTDTMEPFSTRVYTISTGGWISSTLNQISGTVGLPPVVNTIKKENLKIDFRPSLNESKDKWKIKVFANGKNSLSKEFDGVASESLPISNFGTDGDYQNLVIIICHVDYEQNGKMDIMLSTAPSTTPPKPVTPPTTPPLTSKPSASPSSASLDIEIN